MKGHTVPWGFLPNWIQFILALALLFLFVKNFYKDQAAIRRWCPWLSAVVFVLLTPSLVGWVGFDPQGIRARSLAAELQSLATGSPWLTTIVSALQSISTKGMGLKTAGVIFTGGVVVGRLVWVRAYDQLHAMGFIAPQAQAGDDNRRLDANPQPAQAVELGSHPARVTPDRLDRGHVHDD